MRVLIVDDEEDIEPLFRQALRREIKEGLLEISFARDAESALSVLRDDGVAPFDKVISDLNMPGMSGFEFLRRVSGTMPDMDCAVVSANADVTTRKKAETLGVGTFFSKPINFAILRDYVVAA